MLFGRILLGLTALTGALGAAVAKKKEDTKYFHEPGSGDLTGHYDFRFFTQVVDYDTRLDTLQHMVRAWLQMTSNNGIETWIAHGTLLGWWWNAKMLPWDWDLDVQMHADTLTDLGKRFNMLDVNPWIWERVRGDGQNIIDARWIDIRNGLFIDITGIAETDANHPGVLNCKNYHRYKTEDIWPLRDTIFEGVPAKIPYNFDPILVKEYGTKALVVTEYEGHRWNVASKAWERAPDVPSGHLGALRTPRVPEKYSTVETGGVLYNLYRLIHWWE